MAINAINGVAASTLSTINGVSGVDEVNGFELTGGAGGDGVMTGIIGYWKFDDASGTTAVDSSGNGLTGTVSGADWTTGHINGALDFIPANDDYVEVADDDLLDITTAWTIAVWAQIDSTPTAAEMWFVGKDTDTGRSYNFGITNDGAGNTKLVVQINGTNYPSNGTADIDDLIGAFHYFLVTYNGTTASFYIDGALEGTSTPPTPNVTATSLRFGARGYPGFHDVFDGKLDDIKIFGRVLDAGEITSEAAR